ncbi:MAG: PfkB family carbohydrate kinase [Anaerolineaceae bacterium]|nr:PfkB family carbohydrate kinase [Anaerolineaceae bacterium]
MNLSKENNQTEYLIVGHLTKDLLGEGRSKMGGTVSYAGLTALALGNRVKMLSSCSAQTDLSPLAGMEMELILSQNTTTYENIATPQGRVQYMYEKAQQLTQKAIPSAWLGAPLVHLGPVADEIDPEIHQAFPKSFIGITPQGWLRGFGPDGKVKPIHWRYSEALLKRADATVLSLEDLGADPEKINDWRSVSKVLVITRSKDGATVYQGTESRHFAAPPQNLLEDTGAGDIFAACFFHAFSQNADPFKAAPFAVELAASSVTRKGFQSIPLPQEVQAAAKKYGIKAGIHG